MMVISKRKTLSDQDPTSLENRENLNKNRLISQRVELRGQINHLEEMHRDDLNRLDQLQGEEEEVRGQPEVGQEDHLDVAEVP